MTLIHGGIPFTKNKYFEIEINKWNWKDGASWFEACFRWTRHRDHAGLELELEFVGICFRAVAYDRRHWDYDKNAWEIFEEGREIDEYPIPDDDVPNQEQIESVGKDKWQDPVTG